MPYEVHSFTIGSRYSERMEYFCLVTILITWTSVCQGWQPDERLQFGWYANIKEFPFMVALYIPNGISGCSGVIIHFHWVMTAPRCFYADNMNIDNAEVRAGSSYAHDHGDTYRLAWTGTIGSIVEGDHVLGIGMAKTQHEIQFGYNVAFASLPDQSYAIPPPNTMTCQVVGFEFSRDDYQDVRLRYTTAPINQDELCMLQWPWYDSMVHTCVGIVNSDRDKRALLVETDGALICDNMVVAMVTGPTPEGAPRVYTQVAPYRLQIDNLVLNEYK